MATAKMQDYDEQVIKKNMREETVASGIAWSNILDVKNKSTAIFIGQPFVTIATAFAFNSVFVRAGLKKGLICSRYPDLIQYMYTDGFPSIFVSTMLIYWVAQVYPQSLGNKASVEFMRFPGAWRVSKGLALLAKTGIGYPGVWLESISILFGFKVQNLILPLSDEKFFDAMSTDYERYVDNRIITIDSINDEVIITDVTEHVYLSASKEIEHIVRVPESQFDDLIGLDISLSRLENQISGIPKTNEYHTYVFEERIIQRDASGNIILDNSNPQPKLLQSDRIQVIRSSSDKPIQTSTITTKYNYSKLRLDEDELKDHFYFYLGLPTKSLIVRIKYPEHCFKFDAIVEFMAQDSTLLHKAEPIERGTKTEGLENGYWVIRHDYPPLSVEFQVAIDIRAKER